MISKVMLEVKDDRFLALEAKLRHELRKVIAESETWGQKETILPKRGSSVSDAFIDRVIIV